MELSYSMLTRFKTEFVDRISVSWWQNGGNGAEK